MTQRLFAPIFRQWFLTGEGGIDSHVSDYNLCSMENPDVQRGLWAERIRRVTDDTYRAACPHRRDAGVPPPACRSGKAEHNLIGGSQSPGYPDAGNHREMRTVVHEPKVPLCASRKGMAEPGTGWNPVWFQVSAERTMDWKRGLLRALNKGDNACFSKLLY